MIHKKFLVKSRIFSAVLASLVSVIAGCTTTAPTRPVKTESPQGYVEFYHGGARLHADIYQIEGRNIKTLGYISGNRRVTAGVAPGVHKFAVKIGDGERVIDVDIQDRMTTPVRIDINVAGVKDRPAAYGMSFTETTLTFSIAAETPQRVER